MSEVPDTTRIEVRYFAAARAAAGRTSQALDVDTTSTVDDLAARLGDDNPDLARVLRRCSFLRDSVAVRDRAAPLGDCAVIEVLPPFAGG